MNELLTTILNRPYVFAFLAAYLFLAWRLWGWKKTLIWLVSGYAIAWASEYSSIHNSFPYGEYHYIYENLQGELMVAGVPFFDSLSYPFLIFAGYTMAEFMCSNGVILSAAKDPGVKSGFFPFDSLTLAQGQNDKLARLGSIKIIFLGALLTMLLDVIIDPIATMGDLWFLGKIHYYAHPGFYFGVPMTNFGGWFLVALAVIVFNTIIWSIFKSSLDERTNVPTYQRTSWLYPAFYTSIALFNITISFWVGQWKLGIASSAILLVIFAFMFRPVSKTKG